MLVGNSPMLHKGAFLAGEPHLGQDKSHKGSYFEKLRPGLNIKTLRSPYFGNLLT